MKKKHPAKIPLFDLNASAFQYLHGNIPELELQGSRVIFLFNPDETFYRLSALYHKNLPVNIIDFVDAQRRLRSLMISAKGQK